MVDRRHLLDHLTTTPYWAIPNLLCETLKSRRTFSYRYCSLSNYGCIIDMWDFRRISVGCVAPFLYSSQQTSMIFNSRT